MTISERETDLAVEMLTSGMGRSEYTYVLKFPDIRGRRILDIGSGGCDCVYWLNSQGAKAYGLDVRYLDRSILETSVEEGFERSKEKLRRANGDIQEKIKAEKEMAVSIKNLFSDLRSGHYISGIATNLPFSDETFDFVYSINCITHGLDNDYGVFFAAIEEALRVIKPGHEFQAYPFMWSNDKKIRANSRQIVQDIRDKGHIVDLENVTNSCKRLSIIKQ